LESFLADVVEILCNEVAELVRLGATYIQLDAYSARFRPAIPGEAGHPFRLIPATHSGASRPPIPDDSGHPHQCHTAEGGAG
jgi:hypothetical protein